MLGINNNGYHLLSIYFDQALCEVHYKYCSFDSSTNLLLVFPLTDEETVLAKFPKIPTQQVLEFEPT